MSPTPSGIYSQWKKLPTRDPMDRLAKAGTGFSKMLQNIKNPVLDYGETTEETQLSQDAISSTRHKQDSLFNLHPMA